MVIPSLQKERLQENLIRQFKRLKENTFQPIVVDKDYRIVNGHHRYEVLKQLGSQYIEVARINESLEALIDNFADGKKPGRKGLSKRVGIPKGATIAQLEKYAKSKGEKGRMARWQLNMRRGKKKKNG